MRQEAECTIKEASELLNIPASTLRYWEELGLIHSHRLPDSNYRAYSLHALFEASNIAFYRKMGVSIRQLEKMKSRSLEDVITAFGITTEKFQDEITRLERALRRLKYQRALSKHALDLIRNGVREAVPIITRLNAYNPESQWQRKILVRDMQRYALFIDAKNPDEMIESYVDYPKGSEADEDAKSQEDDVPVKINEKTGIVGIQKKGAHKETGDKKEGGENKNARSVGADSRKKLVQSRALVKTQDLLEHQTSDQAPLVLWDRASEIEKGVRFFEGVAFSEYGKKVHVRTAPLFEAAKKAGYNPLYAIAHFLVSADFNGQKDCYRVWIGCSK